MEAHAKGARGHVDCREIVKDNALASALPIVKVTHFLAKVTHEAAIGSIDQKELEILMAVLEKLLGSKHQIRYVWIFTFRLHERVETKK